jgi:mRNA-degrading endonuclease RelE of RelBE toxin-antitoxin system
MKKRDKKVSVEKYTLFFIDNYTSLTYNLCMMTISETPTFKNDADKIWSEAERLDFFTWLSHNFDLGDVIPRSGGCRKIRWSVSGSGKQGGVRVIYFTQISKGEVWLLVIYKKSTQSTIPAHILKSIREVIEND